MHSSSAALDRLRCRRGRADFASCCIPVQLRFADRNKSLPLHGSEGFALGQQM